MYLPNDFKLDWNNLDGKTFDLNDAPECITGIDIPLSDKAEQEFTLNGYVNEDVLKQLAGVPLDSSFSMTCDSVRSVQRRKHKKKRINKKWAKRYGYITIIDKCHFRDVSIVPADCGFEFIAKN